MCSPHAGSWTCPVVSPVGASGAVAMVSPTFFAEVCLQGLNATQGVDGTPRRFQGLCRFMSIAEALTLQRLQATAAHIVVRWVSFEPVDFGVPLRGLGLGRHQAKPGHRHCGRPQDARSLFLTANTTTVYVFTCLDLKDGPLVLYVPPRVLGPADDAYFRWVTDAGITGPDGGKGSKYLFVPPGYTGNVPSEGYFIARPRTNNPSRLLPDLRGAR